MPIIIKHTKPPEELAEYANRFWEVSTTDDAVLRVLPDGSWDFVLHIGLENSEFEFVGPMTTAITIPLEPTTRSYGVRFRPGTYLAVLGKDLAAYIDAAIPLAELLPATRIDTTQPITPQLLSVLQKLAADKLLLRDPDVDSALVTLEEGKSDEKLSEILLSTNSSTRTIERKFQHFVGLRPKQLVRINRQLAVARELMLAKSPSLGALAADFDYVDQAHMTHDLRLLSGTTPAALRQEYDDFLQYDWPYVRHTN